MRMRTALLIAASLSLTPCGAAAQTLQLSWDACDPLVTYRSAIEGLPVDFYASVIGQSAQHSGYQVWWVAGDPSDQMPDAWRFDTGGCQAERFTFSAQPPSSLSKSCPPLISPAAPQFPILAYQFAPAALGFPTTMGNGVLALAYPGGSGIPNPGTRYHAARFHLDFALARFGPTSPGASCGGLESKVRIQLVPSKCSWVDTNGNEFAWNLDNSELIYGVDVAPAPSTWGQIKGQYRH